MKCLVMCLALMAHPPVKSDGDWLSFAVDARSGMTWEFRSSSVLKLAGFVRAQVRRADYDVYEVMIPKSHCQQHQPAGDIELSRPGFVNRAVWHRDDGTLAWEIARSICAYSRRPW